MEDKQYSRIVVLIDADNMPPESFSQACTWMEAHGKVTLCRAYGILNTFQSADSAWVKIVQREGIDVRMLLPVVDGKKNTADTAMMLDAMELAFSGHADAFCLVSADSDFRQLALKLKPRMPVYGLVKGDAPQSYRMALSEYQILNMPEKKELTASVSAPPGAQSASLESIPLKNPLEEILLQAFQEACGDHDHCLKTMLGSKLSAMKERLPEPFCSSKNGLLNKVLKELKSCGGKELFVEEGNKQSTIVRRKR